MTIAIWPVRAILLMGTSLLLAAAAESGTLEAGAAKVDITPSADAGLIMSGYADRKEGFKGVHDHIYARAIVLGDGSRLATLVAWELIGVPDPVWEELSQRIARETGIPSEYLLLCAVHDHSAPAPLGCTATTLRSLRLTRNGLRMRRSRLFARREKIFSQPKSGSKLEKPT